MCWQISNYVFISNSARKNSRKLVNNKQIQRIAQGVQRRTPLLWPTPHTQLNRFQLISNNNLNWIGNYIIFKKHVVLISSFLYKCIHVEPLSVCPRTTRVNKQCSKTTDHSFATNLNIIIMKLYWYE